LAIGPFDDVWRDAPPDEVLRDLELVRRREAVELPLFELVRLDELARPEVDRALLPEEPFLFVDLFVFEPPLDELLLEDRVVCAIVLPLLASMPAALFAPAGLLGLPTAVRFELRAACVTTALQHVRTIG